MPAVADSGPVTLAVTSTADAALTTGCDDGVALRSLREALCLAAREPAAVVVADSGARYVLAAGPLVVDPGVPATITVQASGATPFTIDGNGTQILSLDPSLTGRLDMTLTTVTLTNGAETGGLGGGAILAGSGTSGAPDQLTLTDCTVTGNRNVPAGQHGDASAPGGAVQMSGGSLTIRRCTFDGNVADGAPGGAVAMIGVDPSDTVVIDGSVFHANAVTGGAAAGVLGGGAVWVSGASLTMSGSVLTDNTVTSASPAAVLGSAVYATGAADVVGTVVRGNVASSAAHAVAGALALGRGRVTSSRLSGNTDSNTPGRADTAVLGPLATGTLDAPGNWWGCQAGPSDALCDAVSGGASAASYAMLTATPNPTTPLLDAATTVTVAVRLSTGAAADPDLLRLLAASPVTWSAIPSTGAVLPTYDTALATDGTASMHYTTGADHVLTVSATVDDAHVTTQVERAYAPVVPAPADVAVADGSTATFTTSVDAHPAATLQWETAPAGTSTWTAVPGATGASLLVAATRTAQGDRFRLVATNSAGTTTSQPATLTVLWGPGITTQPGAATVVAGSTASFTVGIQGYPAPTVQWQELVPGGSWADVAGATGTTYVTAPTTAAGTGTQVRAVVAGAGVPVTSQAVTLTVQAPPSVVVQPAATTVGAGDPYTLHAEFSGDPAVTTVRWEWRAYGTSMWTAVTGAQGTVTTSTTGGTTPSELTGTADRALTGDVRAVGTAVLVTGARDAVTDVAPVMVEWGPVISTPPVSTTVAAGADATFTIVADGQPAPVITWFAVASGGTTTLGTGATLTLPAVTLADDGLVVRAQVQSARGTLTAPDVTLTVTSAPRVTTEPRDTTVDALTTAHFTVAVTGSPIPTVRWQVRSGALSTWADVPGGAGTTLDVPATAADDGHQYRAVATNGGPDVTSAVATLRVLTPPTVSTPADVAAVPGSTARFTVTTTGSPTPTVTWESSPDGQTWSPVTGASGTQLMLTASSANDGLRVRAIATSTLVAGPQSVTSAPATLTVMAAPVYVSGPTGTAVQPDGTLQVAAGAPFTIRYVVAASTATGVWEASHDAGATWGPIPAGATTTEITGVADVTVLRGALPATRTAYELTYTPSAADAGLLLRLRVANPASSVTLGPVDVQVGGAAPTPTATSTDVPTAATGTDATGTVGTAATHPSGATVLGATGTDAIGVLVAAFALVTCGALALIARRRRDA